MGKNRERLRQQIYGSTVFVWLLVLVRLTFHAFPEGMPTTDMILVAICATAVSAGVSLVPIVSPGKPISGRVRILAGTAGVVIAAVAALFIRLFDGKLTNMQMALCGLVPLALVFGLQWLVDPSRF